MPLPGKFEGRLGVIPYTLCYNNAERCVPAGDLRGVVYIGGSKLSKWHRWPSTVAARICLAETRSNSAPDSQSLGAFLPLPRRRRSHWLSACLFAALTLSSATFVQPVAAEGNSVRLGVSARIAAFFRLQVDHQLNTLTITAQDIQLGYVDVPSASQITVITNAADGYAIEFHPQGDLFQSVNIAGLQNPIHIGPFGGMAEQSVPHGRSTTHQLGYRFQLRSGLKAGNYAWPLAMSVRSL
jgi:hypothetical protein